MTKSEIKHITAPATAHDNEAPEDGLVYIGKFV